MLYADMLSRARPGRWTIRPCRRARCGRHLIVLVPMMAEEMAASLGLPVEDAECVRARSPMYFCLGPQGWVSLN